MVTHFTASCKIFHLNFTLIIYRFSKTTDSPAGKSVVCRDQAASSGTAAKYSLMQTPDMAGS